MANGKWESTRQKAQGGRGGGEGGDDQGGEDYGEGEVAAPLQGAGISGGVTQGGGPSRSERDGPPPWAGMCHPFRVLVRGAEARAEGQRLKAKG